MSSAWQHLKSATQREAADSLLHARTEALRQRITKEHDAFTSLPAPQSPLEQLDRIGRKSVMTASWRAAWLLGH